MCQCGNNTAQQSRIAAMTGYNTNLLSLLEQLWDGYEARKSEFKELQIELSQHQEQGRRIMLNDLSIKTPIFHQHIGWDEFRARLAGHLPDATTEPREPVDMHFAQYPATSVSQDQ